MNMIHNINNILLIILIMLIMFCACLYVFSFNYEETKYKKLGRNQHIPSDTNLDTQLDNNIQLLSLLTLARDNAIHIIKTYNLDESSEYNNNNNTNNNNNNTCDNNTSINNTYTDVNRNLNTKKKEQFAIVDERLLSQKQSANYILSLSSLKNSMKNQYNNVINKNIQDLNEAQEITNFNKNQLLSLLTNAYLHNCLDKNKIMNAESYNVYLKHRDPSNNKYYKQYTQ